MLVVKTYLAQSGINGFGLFAAEDIEAGALVWEYTPGFDLEIVAADFPPLVRQFLDHYASTFRPGVYLLCGDNARFMNHSDTPNISASGDENFALRSIRADEEITCNYREFDLNFKGF